MPTDLSVSRCALAAESAAMAALDGWFTSFATQNALPDEPAGELRVCLHELFGNVIMHGQPKERRPAVWLTAARRGGAVILTVEDDCLPFNPLVQPSKPPATSLEDAEIGGLGLVLVRRFSTSLRYEFSDAKNRLVLTRLLDETGMTA